jgi:hypothetical protein
MNFSMGLVTTRGSLQKAGRKREAEIVTGTGTGTGTGKETETRIGRKAGAGIGKGTETRIVIVIVIDIEIAVKEGIGAEIGMMMITTEAEIMTGITYDYMLRAEF